jgi:PRTRC genetic system protein A
MSKIPLYLKTSPDMPRPDDSEYYLLTRSGLYFCRNHRWFQSDIPTKKPPHWLAEHRSRLALNYPKLRKTMLEYVVGFFRRAYDTHGSESIVLMLWDLEKKRYRIHVPKQEATVWENSYGSRSAMDVTYDVPAMLPPKHIIAMSIHCHGDHGAYSSWTDETDELHRDGVHAVVGHIDRRQPSFHMALAVDGHRFDLDFDDVFEGFQTPRRDIPKQWMEQLTVKVKRPSWSYSSSSGTYKTTNQSTSRYGGNYGGYEGV